LFLEEEQEEASTEEENSDDDFVCNDDDVVSESSFSSFDEEEEPCKHKTSAKKKAVKKKAVKKATTGKVSYRKYCQDRQRQRRRQESAPKQAEEDAAPEATTAEVAESENKQAEHTKKPKKKQKKRRAGTYPKNIRNQCDNQVFVKLKTVSRYVDTWQKMSLPFSRSDDYEEPDDSDDETKSVTKQNRFPWVVNGCFNFSEQEPNYDGNNDGHYFMRKPVFNLWAPSKKAAVHLEEEIRKGNYKLNVHGAFKEFYDAQRSDKAKAKPAPKKGTKKSSATISL
jgi:hypothetical protein